MKPTITLVNTPKINFPEENFVQGITEISLDQTYPIGLLYISSSIKKENKFNVDYLDANFYNMGYKNIIQYLKKNNSKYVGFNVTFPNLDVLVNLINELKKEIPNIKTIVGGPAATLASDEIIKHKSIDFVVRGEGEKTINILLETLENKKYLSLVKGITYINQGKIISTNDQDKINLDELPLLDLEIIPYELKELNNEISLFTSRGCTSNCSYCSTPIIWGKGKKNIRRFSVNKIFEEIENHKKNGFKFNTVHFIDDNFTGDWQFIEEFIDKWNKTYKKEDLKWRALSRIKEINSEYKLKKMADSGCIQLSVGVESASSKILKEIGKGIEINEVNDFLYNAKKAKIKTKGFFMIGFPNETKEDLMKTLNYALNAGFDDIGINIVKAYPKTRLYESIKNEHKKLPNYQYVKFAAGSLEDKINKYNLNPDISLSSIPINELIYLKNKTLKEFYKNKT